MNKESINLYDQIVDLYNCVSEWNYYDANFEKPYSGSVVKTKI